MSVAVCLQLALQLAAAATFLDDAGRTVEVPDRVARAMAAGPPASVAIYAIAPGKMVGWVRAPSQAEKAFIAEPYRELPTHGRLTGRGGTANLEAVLALKPDLILDVGSVDATYASLADRVQAQTGIPYVLIDGRFADTPSTLRKVGRLLGEEERAEALAVFAERVAGDIEAVLARLPEAGRPRVYYGRGPEGLETGLEGSINMEVLAAVGAANVAASAGAGGLANVSVEQVLAWNPDVIIAFDERFRAKALADPLWAEIAAVRNGRVYRPPVVPFGWFDAPPGVNRLIGAAWLASILYPEHSTGDLRRTAREFYRLFYHVDLSEGDLDALLRSSGAQ